jgi:hypothetical protein
MWASVHGLVSLQIAKCDDPWIHWRDLRQTSALSIDAMIRGIVRED